MIEAEENSDKEELAHKTLEQSPTRPSNSSDLELAEHFRCEPLYGEMRCIRDHLYDSSELQDRIEDFLETNWQKYKVDVHGTYALGMDSLHRKFNKMVEKSFEAALLKEGFKLEEFQIAIKRAKLKNPTGDDACILSILRAAFEFDTFTRLLKEKNIEKRQAIAQEKKQRMEKYHQAGGKKRKKRHNVSENLSMIDTIIESS